MKKKYHFPKNMKKDDVKEAKKIAKKLEKLDIWPKMGKYAEMRNLVLQNFNDMDFLIARIISGLFFGEVRADFVEDVLYDNSMSAYARIQILKKTLKRENMYDKVLNNLDEMNRIRNLFAHCMTSPTIGHKESEIVSFEIISYDVKRQVIDLEEENKKFIECTNKVLPYLADLFHEVNSGEYSKKKKESKK